MRDHKGEKHGRLTIIGFNHRKIKGSHYTYYWDCLCDCGKINTIDYENIRTGRTVSCGCRHLETLNKPGGIKSIKHGMHNTRIYKVWSGMMSRCHVVSSGNYQRYGAQGITVCDSWHEFTNFYRDMGDIPFLKATIDRINNDKGYSPENCRWATWHEQALNRRRKGHGITN